MFERTWWQRLWAPDEGGASAGGEPTPAPTPTPAPASVASGQPDGSRNIDDIFEEFDRATGALAPVETSGEPVKQAPGAKPPTQAAGTGTDPATAQQPPAPPPLKAPTAPAPAQAPQQGGTDPALAALMSQVAALQQQLAQVQGGAQQQPQQPAPTAAPQRRYDLRVPPGMVEAIRGDDATTAHQALEHYANSIAELVHDRVAADTEARFRGQWAPQIVGHVQQTAQQQTAASAYKADFYGTHKDLAHQELFPLVQSTASEYFQELGLQFRGYNPQVRDEIARRVRLKIHGFAGTQLPGAGAPAPATPQRPAGYSSGGIRPAAIQPNGQPVGINSPEGITQFIRDVNF